MEKKLDWRTCKDIFMGKIKYTKEILKEAVKNSKTISGVLRYFSLKQSGGSHYHISKLIKKYEINTDHFLGQGSTKGKPSLNRHTKESFLMSLKEGIILNGTRTRKNLLKFLLIENKCNVCGLKKWNGKDIPLEVDHLNGKHEDNRLENLRLICPNCHALTENYCSKNLGR